MESQAISFYKDQNSLQPRVLSFFQKSNFKDSDFKSVQSNSKTIPNLDKISPAIKLVTSKNEAVQKPVSNPSTQAVKEVNATLPGLSEVAASIAKISDASRSARQADKINNLGLMQGASKFGSDVADIYNFLALVNPVVAGPDSSKKILELGSQYAVAKGNQILSGDTSTQSNPQTTTKAAKAAGTAATTSSALNQFDEILGETGGKLFGAVGAAYSIYELSQGRTDPISGAVQGAATGAYLGSFVGLSAAGALIGGIAGSVSGLFKKSGKPAEQKERDVVRKQLKAAGILDSDWNILLAYGAKFDMGKDGGARLTNLDGNQRSYKEFDLSNPLTQPVAKLVAPLAQKITAGHPRLAQEFTAYLTNAVNSNSSSIEDSLNNLQAVYTQFGISFDEVLKKVVGAKD